LASTTIRYFSVPEKHHDPESSHLASDTRSLAGAGGGTYLGGQRSAVVEAWPRFPLSDGHPPFLDSSEFASVSPGIGPSAPSPIETLTLDDLVLAYDPDDPSDPYNDPHDPNRHRPGDTWQIGGKPFDPFDPGPWRPGKTRAPDRRTGRHRRGELPDPLPDGSQYDIRTGRSPHVPEPSAIYTPPEPRPRRTPPPRPAPHPPRWERRTLTESTPQSPEPLPGLAEAAWHRFLANSSDLYLAHFDELASATAPGRTFTRLRWFMRWVLAILALGLVSPPRSQEHRATDVQHRSGSPNRLPRSASDRRTYTDSARRAARGGCLEGGRVLAGGAW
jgi:hypothetical protein